MTSVIVVTLRGEPQGKGRPRFRIVSPKRGPQFVHVYTPKETQDYERAIGMAGRVAMGSRSPLEGPLQITIEAVMPVPSSWSKKKRDAALAGTIRPTTYPDWDNIAKAASDGLNGVVWNDDRQVVDARTIKRYGEEPMVRVEIAPLATDLLADA